MTHNPLMWASTTQPLITQSTAEAELLAYNSSVSMRRVKGSSSESPWVWGSEEAHAGGQHICHEPIHSRHRCLENTTPETSVSQAAGGDTRSC